MCRIWWKRSKTRWLWTFFLRRGRTGFAATTRICGMRLTADEWAGDRLAWSASPREGGQTTENDGPPLVPPHWPSMAEMRIAGQMRVALQGSVPARGHRAKKNAYWRQDRPAFQSVT